MARRSSAVSAHALLAATLVAASVVLAQPMARRAATVGAIKAFPSFYNGQSVLVRAELQQTEQRASVVSDLDTIPAFVDAGAGLLITSMFGPSLNGNTGDWSVGCSGFWFEDGEIAYPVNEITVAGNLLEIFGRVVPGSDLEIRGASNAPSLLVDALAIAGR